MKRKDDWPEFLAAFVQERLLVPYSWGTNDCVTYPADAIERITGVDPIADIRGSWDSELAANKVLGELGGLIKAVDARFTRCPSTMHANRGDLMLVKMNGRPSLGICVGLYMAAPGDVETLFIKRDEARIAWEV